MTDSELLKIDGTTEKVVPSNNEFFTLQELQSFVNGYIEIIRLSDTLVMVLNEEGKLKNLPLNKKANDIFKTYFKLSNDYIVGNVLISNSKFIR